MIREEEILSELKNLKEKIELLANPLYNDYCGSYFWGDINNDIYKVINKVKNEINKTL